MEKDYKEQAYIDADGILQLRRGTVIYTADCCYHSDDHCCRLSCPLLHIYAEFIGVACGSGNPNMFWERCEPPKPVPKKKIVPVPAPPPRRKA